MRRSPSEAVNEILGRPFGWGATGPEAFYCLGLGIYLWRQCRGVELPSPYGAGAGAFRAFFERWEEIGRDVATMPLDCLYWAAGGDAHVVWVEDSRWVVSVQEGAGVFRQPLEEALERAQRAFRLRAEEASA